MKRAFIACGLLLAEFVAPAARADNDRSSFLRNVVVAPGEKASGDVTCYFCSVEVRGTVVGDVVTIGGDVDVSGTITGDVVTVGGNVRLRQGSIVDLDAVAIGGHASKEIGAHMREENPAVSLPWIHIPGQRHVGWRGALAVLLFYAAAVSLMTVILRPSRLRVISEKVRRSAVITLLAGVAVSALIVFLLDEADRLGRWEDSADLFLLAAATILFSAGSAGIALAIGELAWPRGPGGALAIGVLSLALLQLVPILGAAVYLVLTVCAIGGAVTSGLGSRRRVAAMK